MNSAADHPPTEPDAVFVGARWVHVDQRDRALEVHRALMEQGFACGARTYERYEGAKARGRHVRELMVRLGLHPPWHLIAHTERRDNGWSWRLVLDTRDGVAPPMHPSAKRNPAR